jgi:heme exporter protein D
LVFDAHLTAFTTVMFLLAVYRIQSKQTWNWRDVTVVSGSLALVTYGYFGGRILAPLFALGLLFFATTKHRFFGVLKIWLAYAVTLVPLILFNRSHSGVLTKRLWQVTYIRPDASWKEIASQVAEFVRCYLQDQSLAPLLLTGDPHWTHHVEGSGGAMLFATFILAMAGLLLVIARRWRDPLVAFCALRAGGLHHTRRYHGLALSPTAADGLRRLSVGANSSGAGMAAWSC